MEGAHAKERKTCTRCGKEITRSNFARHTKTCGTKKEKTPRATILRTYYVKHREKILNARRTDTAKLQYYKYRELLEQANKPTPAPSTRRPFIDDFNVPEGQPFAALASDSLMYQRTCELIFKHVEFDLELNFLTPRWAKNVLRLLHVDKFHYRLKVPEGKRNHWYSLLNTFTQGMNVLKDMNSSCFEYGIMENNIREALRSAKKYESALDDWERNSADYHKEMETFANELEKVTNILKSDKWKQYGKCSTWEEFKDVYFQRFEPTAAV